MTLEQKAEIAAKKQNNHVLQSLLALVGILVLGVLMFFYVQYKQNQSDERFCALFIATDDRYRALDPATADPEALKFGRIIHELRGGLHCKKTEVVIPFESAVPQTQATSHPSGNPTAIPSN